MCLTDGLLQAYVDEELSAVDHADAAGHVGRCRHCQTRATLAMERGSRVGDLLAATSCEWSPSVPNALARLHTRIERESSRSALTVALRPCLSLGAGAAVVVAVAAALHTGAGTQPPIPASHTTAILPASAAAHADVTRVVAPPVPSAPAAPGRRATADAGHRPRRAEIWPPTSAESDYFSLVEGEGVPDVGMVVRTVVPLSTLSGSPFAAGDAEPPAEIEVDALVGQDGRILAVRMVDQTTTLGRK